MDKYEQHLEQLSEIRTLMEKSSRFLSLSGLSGIIAGLFALAGAAIAYFILDFGNIYYDENYRILSSYSQHTLLFLIIDALVVLLLSISAGFYFSYRRAKKMGIKFWNPAAKRMLVNLFIPIITGGLLIILLLLRNQLNYVASFTLLFYGLGLINAGKYTRYDINYLGLVLILLGLISVIFIHHGLLFWTIGFGLCHIVYGTYLYIKYERQDLK